MVNRTDLLKASKKAAENSDVAEWTVEHHTKLKQESITLDLVEKLVDVLCEEFVPKLDDGKLKETLGYLCMLVSLDGSWLFIEKIADLIEELLDSDEDDSNGEA